MAKTEKPKTTRGSKKATTTNIKADAEGEFTTTLNETSDSFTVPKSPLTNITANPHLLKLVSDSGLNDEKTLALVNAFTPFIHIAQEWKQKAEQLVVTSIEQKEEMKQARKGRIYIAKIRSSSENLRKKLKEDSIIEGRTIDLIAKTIQGMIEPIETHLENQEKFAEKLEQERVQKLADERLALLTPYGIMGDFYDLGNMEQSQFDLLLDGSKVAYERKLEAEKKAKEEAELAEKKVQLYNERKELLIPYWNFLKEGQNSIDFGEIPQESFDIIIMEASSAKAKYDTEQDRIRKENEILKKREEENALIEKQKQEELNKQILEIRGNQLLLLGFTWTGDQFFHECGISHFQHQMLCDQMDWSTKIKYATEAIENRKQNIIARKKQAEALHLANLEHQKKSAPDKEKIALVIENLRNFELPQVTTPNAQQLITDIQTLINKIINYATEKNNQL